MNTSKLRPYISKVRTTSESKFPGVTGTVQRVDGERVYFLADQGGGYFVSASLLESAQCECPDYVTKIRESCSNDCKHIRPWGTGRSRYTRAQGK